MLFAVGAFAAMAMARGNLDWAASRLDVRLLRWDDQGAPDHITPDTDAAGSGDDPIDAGSPLNARLQAFLRPGDIVVGGPSSPSFAATVMQEPAGCTFQSQALAASIGRGTPAARGCAVAAHGGRVVMIGGEGAFQVSAQEIGQFVPGSIPGARHRVELVCPPRRC